MSISANSLINDSVNFFKNQLGGLFTIALLAAVVSVIIYAILIPDPQLFVTYLESLKKLTEVGSQGAQYWLENMTDKEKNAIIHVFFGTLLPTILGSTILICGVLSYINRLSRGEDITVMQALSSSLPKIPSIFLLVLICSLLVQIGINLFIVPGVLLAIGFSLAPAVLISENVSPFSAIGKSWKIAYANWRIILPMIMIWLASQMLVALLFNMFELNYIVSNGISFFVNNLIAAFVLLYFFRLYMLVNLK
ncbi:YciC family protein [Providencia stuartii]